MNETALQGFVKIVELESFSAAADALFVSQSALSQQIRALEKQLKVELFRHTRRQVILTPAGQAFYPQAKQVLALYQKAVLQAQAVQQNTNPPERHLKIAYSHEALRMFGYDLFALTSALCTRFSPLLKRCTNRSEICLALQKGDADLSFQLDCAEIHAREMRFFPVFYVPEFCIPFHAPADMPKGRLTLEQALQYRWLPANNMQHSFYEEALFREGARAGAEIVRIGMSQSVQYPLASLKMVPGIYYRRPDLDFVRILDWQKGHRFGIVTRADPEPFVLDYVQELQQVLPQLSRPLFGLELECAVQEHKRG